MAACFQCKEKIEWFQLVSYLGLDRFVHAPCWDQFLATHPQADMIMARLRKDTD